MTDFRQRSIQRGYTGDASNPECETTAYSGNQLHSSSQVSLQTYSELGLKLVISHGSYGRIHQTCFVFSISALAESQNFRDVGYKDTIFSHSVFIMWQAECPEHRFQHEIECYYSCHLSAQGYLKVTTALFLADFEKEEHCLVVQLLKYSVHKCMGTTREEVIHLMRAEFLLGMLIRKSKSILVTLPSIASPTLAFVVSELEGPCLYHWYTFAIQFNPLRPKLSLFLFGL